MFFSLVFPSSTHHLPYFTSAVGFAALGVEKMPKIVALNGRFVARSDRIKGIVWEGDGFLLLYKRLELGGFSWPRTKEEALEITPEQYQALMQGLEIVSRHPIQEVQPSGLL